MSLVNYNQKYILLIIWLLSDLSNASKVYVVTPSTNKLTINEGRSAPFYYHNWMRRMDTMNGSSTSTTTKKPKIMTPDLIFAQFESENNGDDMTKSLRKLLQRERVSTTSPTMAPIVVDDRSTDGPKLDRVVTKSTDEEPSEEEINGHGSSLTGYYSMFKNVYDSDPSPVYLPSTSTTTSTMTSSPAPMDVQNIWHIIDNEKINEYHGKWEEVPVDSNEKNEDTKSDQKNNDNSNMMDENFALPGFNTSPGNAGENESRAIRTEPNSRFPYVNLKSFQLKNIKKPMTMTNTKSNKNNLYTSLDKFRDVNYPVRGEAQDVMSTHSPIIDRYNPAQPYLPSEYGSKSKQTMSILSNPVKTTANLVPPPPPAPPKPSFGDSLPPPSTYESFPPYPQSYPVAPRPGPPAPPLPPPTSNSFPPPPTSYESFPPYPSSFSGDLPSNPPVPSYPPMSPPMKPAPTSMSRPPTPNDDSDSDSGPPSSDGDSDSGPGYDYNPPSHFLPTSPPNYGKPFSGYSYNKPMTNENSGSIVKGNRPSFMGYHYNKPAPPVEDSMPPPDHDPHPRPYHDVHSYNPPANAHDSDYPELIFDKHPDNPDDSKAGDDMTKGGGDMGDGGNGGNGGGDMGTIGDDMGMPPPPPPDMDISKPGHDFPHGFKYHDDFDDYYHDHHHHYHTTTTTTTTTEMPRVNRYSYYYLGKKLYYLPLYFSVYYIVYVGALIIKAVLRHKIVYPNSWRPNDITGSFFSKRSVDDDTWNFSGDKLHEITRIVTDSIAEAGEKYVQKFNKK